jgi:hypothetical protein
MPPGLGSSKEYGRGVNAFCGKGTSARSLMRCCTLRVSALLSRNDTGPTAARVRGEDERREDMQCEYCSVSISNYVTEIPYPHAQFSSSHPRITGTATRGSWSLPSSAPISAHKSTQPALATSTGMRSAHS